MSEPLSVSLGDFIDRGQPYYAFERIHTNARANMSWEGTLSTICTDMDNANTVLDANFWHPARLVWGVMNSSLKGEERVNLIRRATNFAIATYANELDQTRFHSLVTVIENTGIENTPVEQVNDFRTLDASSSALSLESAHRLEGKVPESALIFPVCRGGLVAGIQTALLRHRAQDATTMVYPLRYSRSKQQDGAAHVPFEDLNYIDKVADEHTTLIVHDEDAFSGMTVHNLVKYLAKKLPDRPVLGLVNRDGRTRARLDFEGKWWEQAATQTDPTLQ